jgi:riboflavin kinase / FMN adenylyltransferase
VVGDPRKLLPPPGIYAVRGVLRSGTWPGALHVGPRPTFEGSPPSIELYLMDFEEDLYGETVRVDLVRRLRGVRPFASVEGLVAQMEEDVVEARGILDADHRP